MDASNPTPPEGENVSSESVSEQEVRRRMVCGHLETVADQLHEAVKSQDDAELQRTTAWCSHELSVLHEVSEGLSDGGED